MLFKFLITDRSLHRIHKREYDRIGRWLLMAAVLFGCGLGFAGAIPEFAPAAVQAFIARGVLLNVFWEELPRRRQSRLGTFTGAALLFGAALILLRTSISEAPRDRNPLRRSTVQELGCPSYCRFW